MKDHALKTPIDAEIYREIKHAASLSEKNCKASIIELLSAVRPTQKRTGQQNKALHVFCQKLADALNNSGKDMRVVLKTNYFLPWTLDSVKDHIFRPVMKTMYGHASTTDLEKHVEIEKVHEVIMRELGEKHGVEFIPWPVDEKKQREFLSGFSALTPVRRRTHV